MGRRNQERYPARRLRLAVESLPTHTKEAMLRGISANRIIVGAYVDPSSGGVCPMLAAHRNGGRTSVASFARAWDAYTDAKGPRRATRREVTTLRSLLEASLARECELDSTSVSELAAQIRDEREMRACAPVSGRVDAAAAAETGADADPGFKVIKAPRAGSQRNFSWLRPSPSDEDVKDLLAAAEEQLSGAPQPR
jgi:hypothetical protein